MSLSATTMIPCFARRQMVASVETFRFAPATSPWVTTNVASTPGNSAMTFRTTGRAGSSGSRTPKTISYRG